MLVYWTMCPYWIAASHLVLIIWFESINASFCTLSSNWRNTFLKRNTYFFQLFYIFSTKNFSSDFKEQLDFLSTIKWQLMFSFTKTLKYKSFIFLKMNKTARLSGQRTESSDYTIKLFENFSSKIDEPIEKKN